MVLMGLSYVRQVVAVVFRLFLLAQRVRPRARPAIPQHKLCGRTLRMYGIDLGSSASVIGRDDGELLRNELGGHRTTSCVATSSGGRLLGEASFSANARNKVRRMECLA